MQIKKSKVLTIVAALGLLAAAAGTAGALRQAQPWQFQGTDTLFTVSTLTCRTRVDLNPVVPETTLSNNMTLRPNSFYNPEQQCFNGDLKTGSSVSGAVFTSSRTTACSVAAGGTGRGHTWFQIN